MIARIGLRREQFWAPAAMGMAYALRESLRISRDNHPGQENGEQPHKDETNMTARPAKHFRKAGILSAKR